MGNSRSSHTFSSRSNSLSDLTYKIGSTSYNTKKSTLPGFSSSSVPRPEKEKLTTRSSSLVSLSNKAKIGTPSDADKPTVVKRASTISVTKRQLSSTQPAPRQYPDKKPLGPSQFNDNYLQSDVKKLFKANDKRYSQALVKDVDDNTPESLDAKLAILKKQRSKEDLVDGVEVKKSRKRKKAPSLPPPGVKPDVTNELIIKKDTTGAIDNTDSHERSDNRRSVEPKKMKNGTQKPQNAVRKKSAAPAPPTLDVKLAVPSAKSANDTNNNAKQPEGLQKEVEEMTVVSKTLNGSSKQYGKQDSLIETSLEPKVGEQPSTDPLLIIELDATESVVESKTEISSNEKLPNCSTVTVKVEAGMQSLPNTTEKHKRHMPKDMVSLTETSASHEHGQAQATTSKQSDTIDAISNSDVVLGIHLTNKDTFKETVIGKKHDTRTELKAEEDGCHSPSDVENRRDQSLFGQRPEANQAGGVLQISIDTNATKEDSKRNPNEFLDVNNRTSHKTKMSRNDSMENGGNKSDTVLPLPICNKSIALGQPDATPVHSRSLFTDKSYEENTVSEESAPQLTLAQSESKNTVFHNAEVAQQAASSSESEPSNFKNGESNTEKADHNQNSTPDSEISDQSNCPTPRLNSIEQNRIFGVDVTDELAKPSDSASVYKVIDPLDSHTLGTADDKTVQKLESKTESIAIDVSLQDNQLPKPLGRETLRTSDNETAQKLENKTESMAVDVSLQDNQLPKLLGRETLRTSDDETAQKPESKTESIAVEVSVQSNQQAEPLGSETLRTSDDETGQKLEEKADPSVINVLSPVDQPSPTLQTSDEKIVENQEVKAGPIATYELPDSEGMAELSMKFGEYSSHPSPGFTTRALHPSTPYSSTDIFVPDTTDYGKEHKKHKSKYAGIFRITKTMRRFMTSASKPSKSHKKPDDIPTVDQEELNFSTGNWMLAEKNKKPTSRKEYKPTYSEGIQETTEESPVEESEQNTAEPKLNSIDDETAKEVGSTDPASNWTLYKVRAPLSQNEDQYELDTQQEATEETKVQTAEPQEKDQGAAEDHLNNAGVEVSDLQPDIEITQKSTSPDQNFHDAPPTSDELNLEADRDDRYDVTPNSDTAEVVMDKNVLLSTDELTKRTTETFQPAEESSKKEVITISKDEITTYATPQSTSGETFVPEEQVEVPKADTIGSKAVNELAIADETVTLRSRKQPPCHVPDVSEAKPVDKDDTPERDSHQIKRRSSSLAFMTPKAYGSSSSVYRPVSQIMATTCQRSNAES